MEPITAKCETCEKLTDHIDDFKGEKCLVCGTYKQEWGYQEQAEAFLRIHNLTFRAVLVGDDCPRFCEDAAKGVDMDEVNTFPRKTHIHGKHYRCTFSGTGRGHLTIDFWNSYADEEENYFAFGNHGRGYGQTGFGPFENRYWDKYRISGKFPNGPRAKKRILPTSYDVLACIQKNDPDNFETFCADYGYDSDSRKAEETWREVVKEWRKVEKFFTREELTEAQEIN